MSVAFQPNEGTHIGCRVEMKEELSSDFAAALLVGLDLAREAEAVLGERSWNLVSSYGKIMGGPYSGLYVSGVPFAVQRDIVRRLSLGETLLIHLMHTHRSGNYEASSLRWDRHGLVMIYGDREVLA